MIVGMKNASATFQRLFNYVISDLFGCEGYTDVIIDSNTWAEHLTRCFLREACPYETGCKLSSV